MDHTCEKNRDLQNAAEEVSDRILTVPNVISFVRLCLVPVFLVMLWRGHDAVATTLFALAAGTDWIDGRIARRTHAVSKLGQLLDPAVDRILMISGVVGLFAVGRLPLWIILLVLLRDLFLLVGGAWLLRCHRIRVAVIFPGKVATTFLFVGFAGLLLNWPLVPGFGVCNVSWLPGWNAAMVSWGIWFVYVGLVLALATTAYYVKTAAGRLREVRALSGEGSVA